MGSRQGTIRYAIDNKKSLGDIQKILATRGYAPLSKSDYSYLKNMPLASDNPLIRLGQNAVGDLGEIATGLTTLGSMGYQEAKKLKANPQKELKNIASTLNKAVGVPAKAYLKASGSALSGDLPQASRDILPFNKAMGGLGDVLLSTYNTKTSDFGKLPAKEILKNVGQGAYENPVFAGMDLATLGAGKLIPKKAIVKAIHKISLPEDMVKANKALNELKYFIPTEDMGKVNRIIKGQKLTNEVRTAPITKALNDIKNTKGVDPKQITRNLITGVREGNPQTIKATEEFARVNDSINKDLHTHFGLSPEVTRQETVSKYILEQVDPDRVKGLTVDDIKKEMGKFYGGQPVDPAISELIAKGNELYDNGSIKHISEVMRPTKDRPISNDELENRGFLTQRVQGLTSPEELGDVLFDTYYFLNKQTTKSKSAVDSLAEISKAIGRKLTPEEAMALGGNEIVTSPKALSQALGKTLYGGSEQQRGEVVNRLTSSSLGKDAIGKYSNDLYAVDKDILEALRRAQASQPPSWSRKANSLFKSSQLVTPKWVAENRIGNTILNSLEGVNLKDYLEANKFVGKYWKDVPRQLELGTSYSGLLGENFAGSKAIEAMKNSAQNTVHHAKKGALFDAYASANQFFASPFVSAEATMEKTDRWANMIRQAKRYAKENNLKYDDVIKSIKTNDELFNKLNNKVDESLGDYIGRNYYINPKVYDTASWATPFWKYPTQSARVISRQLEANPLRSQAMMLLPAKAGVKEYANQVEDLGIGKDELGGVVTDKGSRMSPAKLERFTANPMTAPFELGYNLLSGRGEDFGNTLSPIFQDVNKMVNFKDRYGRTLSSPKYMNIGNETIIRDGNGKPTDIRFDKPSVDDKGGLALSLLANRFNVPVVQMNRAYMPIASAMRGESYYQPYDTSMMGQSSSMETVPYIFEGKTRGEGKSGISELLGSMGGLRTVKLYPDRPTASHSTLRKAFRKYAQEINMQKGNK